MNQEKPQVINQMAVMLIALSSFMAFSNLMGAMMFVVNGSRPEIEAIDPGYQYPLIANYPLMCLFFGGIGIINIIGGIFLKKIKRMGKSYFISNSCFGGNLSY